MFQEYKTLTEYVKSISHEEKLNKNTKIEYRNQCALNERLFVSYSGCFLYIQIFLKGGDKPNKYTIYPCTLFKHFKNHSPAPYYKDL